MNLVTDSFRRFKRKSFFRFGLPFFILVIGGSFGLKQFTSLRYEFQRSGFISNKEIEQCDLKKKEKVTLESEYEKVKKMDIDSWENVRGPRPWEDSSAMDRLKEESRRKHSQKAETS